METIQCTESRAAQPTYWAGCRAQHNENGRCSRLAQQLYFSHKLNTILSNARYLRNARTSVDLDWDSTDWHIETATRDAAVR
eukprot:SAG31_NODE_3601_length_4085_cov_1.880582_3_plen_82_part_00